MTYELHDLFDTTQSRLILKDPKRYSLQITEDLIIDPADIEHFDTEFNEYDNNRLKHIIIVDNKTNKSYLFTNNSPFIIKGEPFNSLHPPVIAGVLDITSNPLSYVVLNKSSIGTYDALEKFDTNDEITTIDQLIEGMNTIFHYESFIKVELLSHMKIRSKINPSRKPDFNHEEEYLIYSIRKTDNALASVSLRLSIGKIPEILTDPKNHNPKNLKPTTYDYVYEDPKEDLI